MKNKFWKKLEKNDHVILQNNIWLYFKTAKKPRTEQTDKYTGGYVQNDIYFFIDSKQDPSTTI
jgi:hypothetical protein